MELRGRQGVARRGLKRREDSKRCGEERKRREESKRCGEETKRREASKRKERGGVN